MLVKDSEIDNLTLNVQLCYEQFKYKNCEHKL